MLPVKFDFKVNEDRRGTNFEGVEAGHADPEGALNLHVRLARDHLVLSVWPVKGEIAQVTDHLAQILGAPQGHAVGLRLRRLPGRRQRRAPANHHVGFRPRRATGNFEKV